MKATASSLLGSSRSAILSTLLLQPEAELHARALARLTGISIGTLQRELMALVELGLLKRRPVGRQVFYSADLASPIFGDLASLLRKTSGLADVLRDALAPLADRIRVAFVYGSMAAGVANSRSDVDVMIIGDPSFGDVARALHQAQTDLGRDVNPTVISPVEYRAKRRARDGFIRSVSNGARIWLIGDENDFAELGKDRSGASA
jgi:predicted nucleotidyltransferase